MSVTYPIIQMFLSTGMVEFSGTKVISAEIVEEINSLGVELPVNTVEFRILSTDTAFSLFGSFNILTEYIPVMVYEKVDAATIFIGRFYLDEWENTSENRYSFHAVDILGVMAKTSFDGLFIGPTKLTAAAILSQVLVPANFPYTLHSSLVGGAFSGWIPPGDYRGALQQICFAIGATVNTARSEVLEIIPISLPVSTYTVEITDAMKGAGQVVKLLPLVTHITLISHDYTAGLVSEVAFEQYLEAGSHKIVFNKPYYSMSVAGPGYSPFTLATEGGDDLITEGGDFIEVGGEYIFGPNALYLTIDVAGTVTVTGYPWVDNKLGFQFVETGAETFKTKNTRKIEDATMVSSSIAQTVLDRVRDYYRMRYTLNMRLYSSTVKPTDIIIAEAQYRNRLVTSIQKMKLDLTGGFRMTVDSLGSKYDASINEVYIFGGGTPNTMHDYLLLESGDRLLLEA